MTGANTGRFTADLIAAVDESNPEKPFGIFVFFP